MSSTAVCPISRTCKIDSKDGSVHLFSSETVSAFDIYNQVLQSSTVLQLLSNTDAVNVDLSVFFHIHKPLINTSPIDGMKHADLAGITAEGLLY